MNIRRISLLLTLVIAANTCLPISSHAEDIENWEYKSENIWYQSFDYSDKNYISDEDFFGVFDSSKNVWSKVPYIEYENYPALANAEMFVKQGDYTSAKEEITDYYKNKFKAQPRTLSSVCDTQSALYAKIQAYNDFLNKGGVPICIMNFTSTLTYLGTSVTDMVKTVPSEEKKEKTMELAALEKDGHTVNICSRESESKPYIKAIVNGVTKTYYAKYDTYLRNGSYGDENYGDEQNLIIGEADSSNTYRVRVTFDFSDIKPTDTVSSAKFYVKGNSTNASKSVLLFVNSNGAGVTNVEDLTWNNDMARVYASFNGSMGPELLRSNFSQSKLYTFVDYQSLYNMFRATKKEVYAYHAFRLYNNFISKYAKTDLKVFLDDNFSTCLSDKLELGTRAEALPELLAHLSDSSYFNSANFIPMLKFAWQMGNAIVRCWDIQSETTNWGLYQTSGLANIMLNFKEFRDTRKPIEDGGYGEGKLGGWINVVNHRYAVIGKNIIRNDNSFTESIAYGSESASNILSYTENAKKAGTNCELTDELKGVLTNIGLYIMNCTGPNFRDFQIGDSYGNGYSYRSFLNTIASYTLNPHLTWAGSCSSMGEKPESTSILYPENRKAILKSGWENDDVYIDFTADAGISSHNHPDDLSLVMYAYGNYMLSDQAYFNYTANDPMRAWMYSTRAHNTIEVNNLSHKQPLSAISSEPIIGPDGKMLQFKSDGANPGTVERSNMLGTMDFVKMKTSNYRDYSINDVKLADVDFTRSVLFSKNKKYILVTDYLEAYDEKTNHYAQNWHMLPDAGLTLDDSVLTSRSNTDGANLKIIPLKTDDLTAKIENGFYSPQVEMFENARYVSYIKDAKDNTVFNTLLLPSNDDGNSGAELSKLNTNLDDNEASAFVVYFDDGTKASYFELHDESMRGENFFGNYTTDADIVFIEGEEDEINHIYMANGSYLKNTETNDEIINTRSCCEYIDINFDGNEMDLSISNDADTQKIKIGKKERVSSVRINKTDVSFYQQFGNITFTEPEHTAQEVCFKPKSTPEFYNGINVKFTPDEENKKFVLKDAAKSFTKEYTENGLKISANIGEDYPVIDLSNAMTMPGASMYYTYYYEVEINPSKLSVNDRYRFTLGAYHSSNYTENKSVISIDITNNSANWGAFGLFSDKYLIASKKLSDNRCGGTVKLGVLVNSYLGLYCAYLDGYKVGEYSGTNYCYGFVPCGTMSGEYILGDAFTPSEFEILEFDGYMLKNSVLPIISNDIKFNFESIEDITSFGQIAAQTTLYNQNNSEGEALICLAIYDKNGNLVKTRFNSKKIDVGALELMEIDSSIAAGESAKVFLFDSMKSLKPLHAFAEIK